MSQANSHFYWLHVHLGDGHLDEDDEEDETPPGSPQKTPREAFVEGGDE